MIYKFILILTFVSVLFSACNNSSEQKNVEELDINSFEVPDSLLEEDAALELDKETMGEIIQNISSPVEMSALLKDENIAFIFVFV